MNVNCVYESVFVPESSCTNFDRFNPTIDPLSGSITHPENNGIDDSPEMFFDCLGDVSHGIQPTSVKPSYPSLPAFECPSTCCFQRTFLSWIQSFLLFCRHILPVGEPVILRPNQIQNAFSLQDTMLLFTNGIESPLNIFRHMKRIKRNLFFSTWHTRLGCTNLRRPQIHTHALEGLELFK